MSGPSQQMTSSATGGSSGSLFNWPATSNAGISTVPSTTVPATSITTPGSGFQFKSPPVAGSSSGQQQQGGGGLPTFTPPTSKTASPAPISFAPIPTPGGGSKTLTVLSGASPAPAVTVATSSTPVVAAQPPPPAKQSAVPALSYQQLEELILNKWTAELYEQERQFLNQATQINIWDKVINENVEKLTQLHSTMEKVRKQQTKINDDLDVIATHQKDLEACLIPLEKEDLLSVLKGDPARKNLYSNAKKIDSQIKTMSENLKETIEHINETSRSHDTEDPVIQVGRILNAHMESLRWIDEHTARMQDFFDSLLKVHDDLRRESDLSKHDMY